MIRTLTTEEQTKKLNKIVNHGRELLSNGKSAHEVAAIIWNKYGYLSSVKNDKVTIQGITLYPPQPNVK